MFNNRRGREARPAIPPATSGQANNGKRGMFSVLGADVVVKGNINATNDVHIDGRVEGDVVCGTLTQGADSQIFGSVTAETARIAGSIEGAARVKQLTIERTARITGDVEYESITIENGGHVDGRLKRMSHVDLSGPRAVPSIAPAAATAA